ncbi:ABC transporter B family member 18 [Hibiscus syriacus]|uniref:ABC transporter B family member 18 n=1 Tax=Hibiscus syriacus TaxID=106335 RepID=A0A6A2ZIW0_HIBSY|nr:ABC transporter B family member 18 [Hibiscus syriacus]
MEEKDWEELQQRAAGTIRLCLADEVMYHVMHMSSPDEFWKKLESQFMSKSLTTKLKQRLYGLKMKDEHDLAQHVNAFNQIVSDLARLDVKIEDEDKAMILLCLLPPSYEHMVTLTYGKETIKVEEITAALLAHNQRKQNAGESSQADSLYVKGNRDRGRKPEKAGFGKRNFISKSRDKKTIHCYKCKEAGYMKRDCPKLKKQTDEKCDDSSNSVNVVEDANFDCSEGDMLSISTTQLTDVWILDFGCSYHIMPNREWFSTYMSVNSGFVYLGDDRCCNIVGIGDVRIKMYDGSVRTLSGVRHIPDLKKNLISLGILHKNGNIYRLLGSIVVGGVHSVESCDNTTKLWHMRLAHLSEHEYTDSHFLHFCKEHGIKRHFTVRKTPQQNGVAERMNMPLNERARCLWLNAGLPKHFWAVAVNMACYLINRSPRASLVGKVVEEVWTGHDVTFDHLQIFCCPAYVHVPADERSKLDAKSKECIFLGYKKGVKGFKFWDPIAKKIVISRDVVFYEQPMLQQKKDTTMVDFEQFQVEKIETFQLTYGGFATDDLQDYSFARDMVRWMNIKHPNRLGFEDLVSFALTISSEDSVSFHDAVTSQKNDKWMAAMVEEMESLNHNHTWELVRLPEEEQIYMQQPEGFTQPGNEHLVYRLKKSLYGLKQSPRQWYKQFDSYMIKIGYKRCEDRDSRKLWLSQRGYVEKMLKRFAMSSAKPVNTLLANHVKLSSEQCPKTDKEAEDMEKVSYSNAVGYLMYAMVCTSPDLAHVLSQVCKCMSKPGKQHWEAVKWIFRYLKGTVGYGIVFCSQRDNPLVVKYVDSDYVGDLDNRRSTTGYVFTLGGGPICWKSTVQSVVALSITEVEYLATAEAAKEALWLTGLMKELGVQQGGIQLLCDNQSIIHLVKNHVYRARTKHIDVRFHKIRELVASGEILFQKFTEEEKQNSMEDKKTMVSNDDVKKEKHGSIISIFMHADGVDIWLIAAGFIGAVADGSSSPLIIYLVGRMFNSAGGAGSASSFDLLTHNVNKNIYNSSSDPSGLFPWLTGCSIYDFDCLWWIRWVFPKTSERQASRMRTRYLKAVLRQDVGYFDLNVTSTAEVVTSVSNDSLIIQDVLSEKVPSLLTTGALFIGSYTISFLILWRLYLVIFPFIILMVAPSLIYGRILHSLARKIRVEYNRANTIAEQAVSPIRTVYAFVSENKTTTEFSEAIQGSLKLGLRQGLAKGLAIGSNGIQFAIWAFIIFYGSRMVIELGIGLSNVKPLFEACAAAERINEMIKRVPKIDLENVVRETLDNILGEFEFNQVEFAYPSRPESIIFKGFYLRIPVGKTVALLKCLRSQMRLVSQEPILFATTIKENILFGNEEAGMEEVGERGIQMSGGQKQRIAIARAFIKAPKILLLDEATSALDSESERIVQEALDKASIRHTTIIVAHRLSTVRHANLIIVVQHGQVIEIGSHNELMDENSSGPVCSRLEEDTSMTVIGNTCDYFSCAGYIQVKVANILSYDSFQIPCSHSCDLPFTCSCPTISF